MNLSWHNQSKPIVTSLLQQDERKLPPPQVVAEAIGVSSPEIQWLAGDGSDRSYFRITAPNCSKSYVLMLLAESDAPALKKGQYEWIPIGQFLQEHHLKTPTLVATLPTHNALIIEDFGDLTLESYLKSQGPLAKHAAYTKAIEIWVQFLKITPHSSHDIYTQRAFDTEKLLWELQFFRKEFMENACSYIFSPAENRAFSEDIEALALSLAPLAKHFVHRDFHSRNLMVLNDKNLGVIDFQDARLGPPAYDLVSLIWDSYIPMSQIERQGLFEQAVNLAHQKLPRLVVESIEQSYMPTLLQRTLKAIGSFAYLTLRKKRGDYMHYVPKALSFLEDAHFEDRRWPFLSIELPALIRDLIRE